MYPRSFADSDGDGTGDVNGIRSKLPYLRDLGVDAIWISPWYTSPLNDGGYDVADYRDIDPRFGTLADAEALFEDAHAHGIKVIVDLVPNHSSSEHPWFKAALAAGPGSPERARYIFKDGKGKDGSQPPTNWTAVFGGSAWERVADGQWYLHLFDPTQPDLNWENEEVRAEFDDIFRFWLDRGVDGFRIDVAHGLVKDPTYPDITEDPKVLENSHRLNHPYWDRDGIHEINRRWRAVLDSYDRDVMMVAEAWVDPSHVPLYLRPDEYHQSFNFDFLETPWDIAAVKKAIDRAVTEARDGRLDVDVDAVEPRRDAPRQPLRIAQEGGVARLAVERARRAAGEAARCRARPAPGASGHDAAARAARLDVHLPRRGARPARRVGPSARGARRPDVGALGPHGEGSRRVPCADPVGSLRPVVRVRRRQAMAAAAGALRRAVGRGADGCARVDARDVPRGDPPPPRAAHGRRGSSSGSTPATSTCSPSGAARACCAS